LDIEERKENRISSILPEPQTRQLLEECHAPVEVQSRSLYLKKNILDRLLFGVLSVILHIVGKKYKSEKGGLLYLEDTPPGWLKK